MPPRESTAVLILGFQWAAGDQRIPLSSGVSLCPIADSKPEALYHRLCKTAQIDDGDPFSYETMFLVEPTLDAPWSQAYGDPYAVVDRLCTLSCIATSCAPWMIRIICSSNHFRSSSHSELLAGAPFSSERIGPMAREGIISEAAALQIDRMWSTTTHYWRHSSRRSRIINAVTQFYHGWRSHHLEQVCLNLAISLEVLFAPHHHGETTHQLSLAIAKFVRSDRAEREQVYDLVRRFYGCRSAIVHGGLPNDEVLDETTVAAFDLASEVFRRVLNSVEAAKMFEEEASRKKMLKDLLFE